MELTKEEAEILEQRKETARIDTKVIKEFGKMIKPKESKWRYRRKLSKLKEKLSELNEKDPESVYHALDDITYQLEDLIELRIGLRNRVIIARIHTIGCELIDTIEVTFAFEVCKENKELRDVVQMYSFEDGWGFDTRDFINRDKSKKGMFQ